MSSGPAYRTTMLVALVIVGGADCANDGAGPSGGGGGADPKFEINSGDDGQVALTGAPVQVRVILTGVSNIQNQTISWSVLQGSGSVPATSQTNNTGVASVTWTLGSEVGLHRLKAVYAGTSPAMSVNVQAATVTNPQCVGGRVNDGSTTASGTWSGTAGPIVLPAGAAIGANQTLTVSAGTVICLGPLMSLQANGGRLVVNGSAAQPVTFTAMDLSQPWGSLRFDGAVGQASTLTYADLGHGSLGATGLSTTHPMQIDNSTITHMTGLGVRLIADGSYIQNSTISDIGGQPGALAARLGSPTGSGSVAFRARATATPGINVEGGGVSFSDCDITGNFVGIYVADGGWTTTIANCNLLNNTAGTINNNGAATVTATGNWWGNAAGPPVGAIVGVTAGVDASNPLSAPVALGYLRRPALAKE